MDRPNGLIAPEDETLQAIIRDSNEKQEQIDRLKTALDDQKEAFELLRAEKEQQMRETEELRREQSQTDVEAVTKLKEELVEVRSRNAVLQTRFANAVRMPPTPEPDEMQLADSRNTAVNYSDSLGTNANANPNPNAAALCLSEVAVPQII